MFLAFYGTRWFITLFTTAHAGPYFESHESRLHLRIVFFLTAFNIILSFITGAPKYIDQNILISDHFHTCYVSRLSISP